MKAVVRERYGGPETLELRQVSPARPGAGQVSIGVMAASLNAADVHLLHGRPLPMRLMFGLLKPKSAAFSADVAGEVLEVSEGVTEFVPGDRVFGDLSEAGFGAFAQQVVAPATVLARIPEGVSYQAAAASGMGAVTALHALRGKGREQGPGPGERVLVTGASGLTSAKAWRRSV